VVFAGGIRFMTSKKQAVDALSSLGRSQWQS